jgi:hypothetical protein
VPCAIASAPARSPLPTKKRVSAVPSGSVRQTLTRPLSSPKISRGASPCVNRISPGWKIRRRAVFASVSSAGEASPSKNDSGSMPSPLVRSALNVPACARRARRPLSCFDDRYCEFVQSQRRAVRSRSSRRPRCAPQRLLYPVALLWSRSLPHSVVHLEALAIVAAAASDIEDNRDAIVFGMAGLMTSQPDLLRAIAPCPPDHFASMLLDQVLMRATTDGSPFEPPPPDRHAVAGKCGPEHLSAIEHVLTAGLSMGMGPAAKTIVINAWTAAYRMLIEL